MFHCVTLLPPHSASNTLIPPHRADDKARAKYELVHTVRSHIGADDDAFNAIRQLEDEEGRRGILLQRNVVASAGLALKTNVAALAPLVLPLTELVRHETPGT